MNIKDAFKGISKLAFDTAPIIYFVEKHPDYLHKMRYIFQRVDMGQIMACSATITLTEVLNFPIQQNAVQLIKEYEDILQNSKNFQLIPIDSAIARVGAHLRAKYRLKTPDALQIATALETKSDAFLTNDFQLKRVQELPIIILSDLVI
ncbi:MAG: PIN domain-containing protein [Anaerolineae bacterium]|jgi:predicted nucleic acid-binding protein|nr:PIN domain-containing protein [Anaerolineae bacterium]